MATLHQPPTNGINSAATAPTTSPPFFDPNSTRPIRYGVLLFPGFQALDVFGPLDVFNSLSMLYNFPTKLTILAKTKDAVETSHQRAGNMMFSHPDTNVSQSIVVNRTFEEQLKLQESDADSGEAIDVLIVPGGVGTRNDRSTEIDFVKEMYPSLKAVLSVCTGATILARAGVLDGRRATTNKRAFAWATSTGPNVKWVAEARWVVDGNIVTGSGISAGIDATYAFVALNYSEKIAQELADGAEYVRWTDPDHDPFAKRWNAGSPYQRTPILSTGFNRSTPSSPASAVSRTVPASNVAFFDENRFCKESPFRSGYDTYTVFFTDLAIKCDVEDFFTFTGQESHPRRDSRRTKKYCNAVPVSRYNPADDDLAVWK
ncbi:class I glutamine amidotransferase-like protein [Stemphylium lycopersici]|uniref:Class I glutamine amidotransferase-like protein n=1 Tax=Stemphylium lycopersici TaxID=183478 RepID=A0A364MWL0_STELY|nr:class I glutamine amidotransferase-like protein [Stemphylium lycopersici]